MKHGLAELPKSLPSTCQGYGHGGARQRMNRQPPFPVYRREEHAQQGDPDDQHYKHADV